MPSDTRTRGCARSPVPPSPRDGGAELEFFVTGNGAIDRRAGGLLTHPTLAELAQRFASSRSIRVHVDSAEGGGLACACGAADFCAAVAPAATLEVVLQNAYPLGTLPLDGSHRARVAWLARRHPQLTLRTVCAPSARALSAFQAPDASAESTRGDRAAATAAAVDPTSPLRGVMVYGTGSSVGKGTVALLLGLALRWRGEQPVPFKALSGLSSRFPLDVDRNRCPSMLLRWNTWGDRGEPLPHFLDPLVMLPPESHGTADGALSMFDPGRGGTRVGRSYRLGELYGGAGFGRLNSALDAAVRAGTAFTEARRGVLVAEGSGSPLDLVGEWDLANESVRQRFGIPYLLVAPADVRGYFGLAGTLVELGERGLLPPLLGVLLCETRAAPGPVTGTTLDATRELLHRAGVPFLGFVRHDRLISSSLNEDAPPSRHTRASPHWLAGITRAFERAVDVERIAAAAAESF